MLVSFKCQEMSIGNSAYLFLKKLPRKQPSIITSYYNSPRLSIYHKFYNYHNTYREGLWSKSRIVENISITSLLNPFSGISRGHLYKQHSKKVSLLTLMNATQWQWKLTTCNSAITINLSSHNYFVYIKYTV